MKTRRAPPGPPADGFLSRWSRRKDAVRQGLPVAEPQPLPPAARTQHHARPQGLAEPAEQAEQAEPLSPDDPIDITPEARQPEPLSLADAQALRTDSDFVPFMARGVAPEVRNAAMKKLFADPHYNVMDGLDIYIDDYSKSVPLDTAVIRRLASAQFLGLFNEKPQPAASLEARAGALDMDADEHPALAPFEQDDTVFRTDKPAVHSDVPQPEPEPVADRDDSGYWPR